MILFYSQQIRYTLTSVYTNGKHYVLLLSHVTNITLNIEMFVTENRYKQYIHVYIYMFMETFNN